MVIGAESTYRKTAVGGEAVPGNGVGRQIRFGLQVFVGGDSGQRLPIEVIVAAGEAHESEESQGRVYFI
jgi:hypothetical protein